MKRLPVNLASQPIEQRQWLRRVTLITAAITLLLSAGHGLLVWSLWDQPQDTNVPDAEAMALVRRWGNEVTTMVSGADPRDAREVAVSVGFANALIGQRVFPWASLFSMLEESMPDNVRLEQIQPIAAPDGVRISFTAASLSADSLREFLAALEARPQFVAVYPGRQSLGIDGEFRLSVEGLVRIDRKRGAQESGADEEPGG